MMLIKTNVEIDQKNRGHKFSRMDNGAAIFAMLDLPVKTEYNWIIKNAEQRYGNFWK
jgi:hypothetical protein